MSFPDMPQIVDGNHFSQNCVARALFDNTCESPDELSFKKGDVLTVLEQNTAGLEGWWLCSLKGRQGICPGNRLRLLAGVYDTGHKVLDDVGFIQIRPELKDGITQKANGSVTYDNTMPTDNRYDVLPFGQPVPVFDQNFLRGSSISRCSSRPDSSGSSSSYGMLDDNSGENDLTDRNCQYDVPKSSKIKMQTSVDSNCYDIPRAFNANNPDIPNFKCESFNSNNTSDYDVPPTKHGIRDTSNKNKLPSYDVPATNIPSRELPLEMNSAIESLERLENEVTVSINTLLSFAGPCWRNPEQITPKIMDIKLNIMKLRSALHDLFEFSDGVLGNAMSAPDKGLLLKLKPLTKALFDTNNIVQETAKILDDNNWSLDILVKSSAPADAVDKNYTLDPLDQLIFCARRLTDDVKEFTSFVQGNATLLFRKNGMEIIPENGNYTNIEMHKSLGKENYEVRNTSSSDVQKSNHHQLIKESVNEDMFSGNKHKNGLDHSDKKVLSFYATQCSTHSLYLANAIGAFLKTVEQNQPPKEFLPRSKFVILSAHRLVHIGDTVHQNVTCIDVNSKVLQISNALAESLAILVQKIKIAATEFPKFAAVEEMVNSAINVLNIARELKMLIIISSQKE